ncbi:uncharacterized protein MYCFIDRAFT_169801 [Pseudocercospora fijiensis CIRAD86]|uniref:Uncharacterized protein n=1 Tax=Pseudocercospora fijiensis (strain CIRAD86) TaxID=383855 RepID=N1QAS0_PSEFD|nr:uncharacterized protein MYCFIDRAFT_169801 [Pseudocercospora fijiensis CIRAD86]EME88107.1 hypothetical protein MYCFIDRAFT_169801 [Pseudocercospora fijiensis CIRAD86]
MAQAPAEERVLTRTPHKTLTWTKSNIGFRYAGRPPAHSYHNKSAIYVRANAVQETWVSLYIITEQSMLETGNTFFPPS